MEMSVTALVSSSAWQHASSHTFRRETSMMRESVIAANAGRTGYRMEYRRLGRAGLKVSALSFGSWVTYGNQLNADAARECMAAAWDRGVNFFDNAEVYARGQSEEIMGATLKKLAWPRLKFIVSTKF